MAHFYINNETGTGYIVTCMGTEPSGYFSCRPVRNFGDRQTDAIEFRDDCNAGRIDFNRLRSMMATYTNQPYRYFGKGRLQKQTNNLITQ